MSFSLSGRQNCDTGCRLLHTCYASKIERLYPDLKAKLARHYRNGPLFVLNRAIAQWKPVKWARLSVDGSLPPRSSMSSKAWATFGKRLRVLVQLGIETGAQWHIPVESVAKARSYRALLAGLNVVVRRTSQAKHWRALLGFTDQYAWVVAKSRMTRGRLTPAECAENTAEAYRVAEKLRAHGQSGVVCSAVARDSKCGQCTACADPRVDFVLYPLHN